MSNSNEQALDRETSSQSPSHHSDQAQAAQWEVLARDWFSTMPEGHTVTVSEVEAWVDSNQTSLPEEFKSLPSSQLFDRFTTIQNCMALPNKEMDANQIDLPQARFQRTDQWLPVYSWLESLDKDEVVKSKDISDWLSDNPKVQEQLYSRHSRYHLMHYIKKCHVKILKRREKKMGLQPSNKATPVKVQKSGVAKQPAMLPCNSINNLPKDSDMYIVKRKEAFQKYEILVELEKQLSTVFSKKKM